MANSVLSVVDCVDPIAGTTRMAERIRAYGWEATSLGPISGWSETLIANVNLMLCSPYPTILAWGNDLALLFNDASVETVESRRTLTLGSSCRDVFRDIWSSLLGSDAEACMARGKAVRRQNTALPHPQDDVSGDRYWSYSMIPLYESGRIAGILNLFQDTTAAVVTKLRLVRERADLDALFEDAPAFIALYAGPEHTYKMVNRSYVRTLGERHYVGLRLVDVFPEAAEQGVVARLDEVYRTGKSYTASNARFTLRSTPEQAPEDIYVDLIYHARRDVDGEVCGIIEMGIDVTEQQRVLQALIESEKVAAVGRLASSIAHEINNPLASAVNYLYLAEMSETVEEVRRYLGIADRELKRVSAISTQTLLSQKHSSMLNSISFQEMVESILPLYNGPIWNAEIQVETLYRSPEPVICSEGEIRQVISNLVSNAIDAMQAGGGRLTIRAREGTDWRTGKRGQKLTVADTGEGIAPGTVDDIFKAFFTTKGFAGNGLGLWVCREIVARHGGRLSVRSSQREGRRGTVFTLYLPREVA